MGCVKIIEFVGSSDKSWNDAINEALMQARKEGDVSGLEISSKTAKVEDGTITKFKAVIKAACKTD